MPIDLLEDLSLGKSWLSFARGSSAIEYEQGEYRKERKKYEGKTYDSVDSIAEFFKQRSQQLGKTGGSWERPSPTLSSRSSQSPRPKTKDQRPLDNDPTLAQSDFPPGSYVVHSKYGRGLVLRREGVGDSLKLTVSFAGYGQKKLVQKYANLEKA